MSDKALFIPLKTEHYEAFASGEKRIEYRLPGPRWNAKTCYPGRPVILSKGYGKKHRLVGEVVGFSISAIPCGTEAWMSIYGEQRPAACIQIEVLGVAP